MADYNHNSNNRPDSPDMDPASRPLLDARGTQRRAGSASPRNSNVPSYAPSFLDQVAEGIQEEDLEDLKRQLVRYVSFAVAIISW
jgi:hypothetical protein